MLAIWRLGRLGATAFKYVTPHFLKNKNIKIKAIKMVLELFKMAKQSCNM